MLHDLMHYTRVGHVQPFKVHTWSFEDRFHRRAVLHWFSYVVLNTGRETQSLSQSHLFESSLYSSIPDPYICYTARFKTRPALKPVDPLPSRSTGFKTYIQNWPALKRIQNLCLLNLEIRIIQYRNGPGSTWVWWTAWNTHASKPPPRLT